MAQRKEARIFVTIWDDQAFRAHSPAAQRMYLYLLSQKDLSYCGVIALRERRWARDADGLTVKDVLASIEELGEGLGDGFGQPLIVVDEDTGELLVRSLIRHDGVWKVPNFLKAARESAQPVQSSRIRAVLADELRRLPLEETSSGQVLKLVKEFIADLEPPNPSAKGSGNPSPNPSGNPSAKGSAKGSDAAGAFLQSYDPGSDGDQAPESDTAQESAGQSTAPNPSANPSGKGSAKGSQGNRGTSTTCTTDSPVPHIPGSPVPRVPDPPGKASSEIAPRSSDATPPGEPELDDKPAPAADAPPPSTKHPTTPATQPSEALTRPGSPTPTPSAARTASTHQAPAQPPEKPSGNAPTMRPDVERLCQHLADRIKANGSKRPTINDKWRDAARLMLDRDGRTEQQIHACIDWCQSDDFWHRNILSMPTLRAKYDQLRLAAKPKADQRTSNRHVESSAADQLAEVFGP